MLFIFFSSLADFPAVPEYTVLSHSCLYAYCTDEFKVKHTKVTQGLSEGTFILFSLQLSSLSRILQQNTSVVNIYTWITPDGPFLTRERHSMESACQRTLLILY